MKTIVALTDNHYNRIPQKLLSIIEESDYVFYLGDGVNNASEIMSHRGLTAVKGNCDPSLFPAERVVDVEGIKCLITHGDRYGVKRDLLALTLRAEELCCQAVFYGHTHVADVTVSNDITLINPGALYNTLSPSYAYAVVTNGKLVTKIVTIN